MIWRIYRYYNPIEDKSYIGQTTLNVNYRAGKNGSRYHKGTPLKEAIDKYGLENFEQSILRLCTSQEEADEYERLFIDKYNAVYPNGYNLESGGKVDKHHSIESIRRISEAMNRPEVRQKVSELTKEAMSKPEVRQKRSDSMKGNTNVRGKKWFNDGTKNIRAYECPEGYIPGRLKS